MKNPMKVLAITTLVLLVGFIVFILVAKQTTESGDKVGYFLKKDEDTSSSVSNPATV
jgi:hypothetical protein